MASPPSQATVGLPLLPLRAAEGVKPSTPPPNLVLPQGDTPSRLRQMGCTS
jgi:hypothetical protein